MPTIKYTTNGTVWNTLPATGPPGLPGPIGPAGPVGTPGVRNKILNGDFAVNQRAFTTATTASSGYLADRWIFDFTVGAGSSVTNQAANPGELPESSQRYARLVSANQNASSGYTAMLTRIEGVRTLAGKTATVSFWARAATGTPNVSLVWLQQFDAGAPDVYGQGAISKIPITTTWARYSTTFTVPAITGGSPSIGTRNWLEIEFWTSAGSANSVYTGSLGIQNNTIDIWGVQLEEGSYMTNFEMQTYADNLRACQRYFQRWTQPPLRGVMASATAVGRVAMSLPVTMWKTPTLSQNGNLPVFDGVSTGTLTSIGATYCSPSYIEFDGVATSFSAAARPCIFYQGGTASLDLSAEVT